MKKDSSHNPRNSNAWSLNRLGKEGFTLIEVLVAIVIITIGLLAVASMQTTAASGNTSSRNLTIAAQLTEEMIDRVRANAGDTPNIYNGLDTNACAGTDPVLGDCTQWRTRLQNSGLSGARGQVTVTNNNPIVKTATITVTVTWGTGITRNVSFTTIMETWII